MSWKRPSLLFLFLILVSCRGAQLSGQLQDSYDLVTLTPSPTQTAIATAIPATEDASGMARAFFLAWEGEDYLGMYSLLSPQSQGLVDSQSFVQRYEEAMETATVQAVSAQPLSINQKDNQAQFEVRVTWQTAIVGAISRDYTVPLVYDQGRWGIVWAEGLILPELAGGNRLHMDYRIPARANIYDRNGLALSYQGTVVSLGVIPGEIQDEAGLLAALAPVLNKTPEEIKELYAAYLPDWYAPIGDIAEEVMQANAVALQPYIGAGLAQPTTRLGRLHSDAGVAAHIVGHTGLIPAEEVEAYKAQGYQGDEIVGRAGLELWGEDYLNGDWGGTLTVVGPNGEYITTVQESAPKQARSIYATFDRDFQAMVEQALAEAVTTYPGGQAGAVVVLDVNSGAVRAMASYPTYNSLIFDSVRPDAGAELSAVLADPGRPLLNRATQGAYPAGSLFKIVTMAAALNSGAYNANTTYTSTGSWSRLGDAFIKHDWLAGGHGTVSLRQALVVSCNSCFYDVGYNLDDLDTFLLPNTARQFGLGAPTGIQIEEAAGLIPDPDWKLATYGDGWARGDAVNMAIGQGFVQVTPLQEANILAAVANGGALYRPTVVDRIGAGGGAPEEPWPAQAYGQLPLSPENLATMRESLWNVAHSPSGTATHRFVGLNVPVAGKTGTAEDPPRNSHAWFAGYAPAAPYTLADGSVIETPQIAIAVIVENAGEGSAVAAPIFRRIVELYYGITPPAPFPW
jgi:penicillin-binding protein 2